MTDKDKSRDDKIEELAEKLSQLGKLVEAARSLKNLGSPFDPTKAPMGPDMFRGCVQSAMASSASQMMQTHYNMTDPPDDSISDPDDPKHVACMACFRAAAKQIRRLVNLEIDLCVFRMEEHRRLRIRNTPLDKRAEGIAEMMHAIESAMKAVPPKVIEKREDGMVVEPDWSKMRMAARKAYAQYEANTFEDDFYAGESE